MEFEKTPLWADVRKIFSSGSKPVRFEYRGTIHTEKQNIDVIKIISIDIESDFVNKIGDYIVVEFVIPFGQYVKTFYPNRSNIEFTILRQELFETGVAHKLNVPIQLGRYKLIFLPNDNEQPSGKEYSNVDEQTLNNIKIVTVKVQLIDRSLEPLRVKTMGGVFRNVYQENLLSAILLGESKKILVDGKPCIDGVDIIPLDNKEKANHVIIPHGTSIVKIPTYFQQNLIGIYNAGVGTYLQIYNKRKILFVYPLFNYLRFDENVNKMIFYAVPKNRFPMIERTYRSQGDITYVAVAGDKQYTDSGETSLMDKGSGFRMADARSFMKKPVKIVEGKPTGVKSQLNFEVANTERKDNLNYAPISDKVVSSNPFTQFSDIAKRSGGQVTVTWVNSQDSLIYPGMPCKYVFMNKDNRLIELKGIIIHKHTLIQLDGEGITVKSHRTTTLVTIFTEPFQENS